MVSKRLYPIDAQLQALESFQKDVKRMDGDTLRRDSRERWNIGWE